IHSTAERGIFAFGVFPDHVNLRPVRLFPGVPCPLAGKQPGDIDFYVVRENTEGEYSSLGGRVNEGTEHEVVIQESVFTRRGVDRILRYAFELAQSRPRKTLTSATKSNGLAISMPYWDERVEAMAENYPEIRWDKQHIDILCAEPWTGSKSDGKVRSGFRLADGAMP
ncbi:isocitrate/isopropylmalate family dehydrogenase, partial [Escherichia sp. R-CC3]